MSIDGTAVDVRTSADPVLPSARTLGKGLAVLRIFLGTILLVNGLAKLFGVSRIEVGPYVANSSIARQPLHPALRGVRERGG